MNETESPNHSLSARLLAAILDYLLVITISFTIQKSLAPSDWSFLVFLGIGALYYTASASSIWGGRSIGKKIFGLRTIQYQSGSLALLTTRAAFVRFLIFLGIIVTLKETPAALYRIYEISGSRMLLDLPLLFALVLFFANIACFIVHPRHRSLHDICTGSIVLRGINSLDTKLTFKSTDNSSSSVNLGITAGAMVGFLFWYMSVIQAPTATHFLERQYTLEKQFNFRLIQIHEQSATLTLSIELLYLSSADLYLPQCEQIANALQSTFITSTIPDARASMLEITCYGPHMREESDLITVKREL